METRNFFKDIPANLAQELVEVIASNTNVRIERIISSGHVTPEGQWYDQAETEWVILLQGEADILFAGESSPRYLKSGDFLLIRPHHRHRVVRTSNEPNAIWLAVFY